MVRNFLILSCISALFCSCAPKGLYYWGKYDQATYKYNKYQTEESIENLIEVYEKIIKNKNKGSRHSVPPGVYADYGYLLIKNGEIEKGENMLEKEIEIYPESIKVVQYVLNK